MGSRRQSQVIALFNLACDAPVYLATRLFRQPLQRGSKHGNAAAVFFEGDVLVRGVIER